jgi:hypothetical protein
VNEQVIPFKERHILVGTRTTAEGEQLKVFAVFIVLMLF